MRQLLVLIFLLSFHSVAKVSADEGGVLPVRSDIGADFSYQRQFVEIDGLNMAYYEAGQGRPIVFVHGIATWSYIWRNVMPHLEGYGRVIAVDLPGFGYSDAARGLTPGKQADYLETFIQKMELKDVTLILHDFGAIGLNYAHRNPDNVAGVAMMELPIQEAYTGEVPSNAIFSGQADQRTIGFVNILRDASQSRSFIVDQNRFVSEPVILNGVTRKWSAEEILAYSTPFADRERREGLRDLLANFLLDGQPESTARTIREQGEWLIQAKTPKLAIVARPGSLMTADFVRSQAGRIPNLQVVEVGQSRHLIMEDHPHALGLILRGWIAGL